MYDLLILNGSVIDGSGRPARKADIAIENGIVAALGDFGRAGADRVIDAAGRTVAPGFIDMHSHADLTLPALPTAESLVHQGITTAVVGQCGHTLAPLLDATRRAVIDTQNLQRLDLPWERWSSFGSFLDFLSEERVSTNVVHLVGQGTIRGSVMGFGSEAAGPDEVLRMQEEVGRALDAGAFGLSTGLEYPPGSYAQTDELIALTRPVGERKALYFSHLRNEAAYLDEAVEEAIRIGEATKARVQISHLKAGWPAWDRQAAALERIERGRAAGLDVSFDIYPYTACSTSLTIVLPEWVLSGGADAARARLSDPLARKKITAEIRDPGFERPTDWTQVMISRSQTPGHDGRFVSELAAESGKEPEEWVYDALLEAGLGIRIVRFGVREENLHILLRHPLSMIGSDGFALATSGPLATGKPHPRNFGTFPRVLGRYVREERVLGLEEAVRKMTGFPAEKLGLPDRGKIGAGFKADIVIFDPETVIDTATYPDPFHYPKGIDTVLVNGRPVLREGVHTGERPGTVILRSGRA